MSFDKFRYILDSNPQIKEVELSNWGEIFLNPEIGQMIKYAYEHNVSLLCNNGTNFNYVKEEVLEALVKYKVKCLNLSIDGACQETYVLYRRNGSFEKVMENIAKLNSYKHQYDSDYPKLSWQFIIFGHNEHEISVVKEMCVKMGMTFNPKMNHSSFSPIKDSDMVKRETGLDYGVKMNKEDFIGKKALVEKGEPKICRVGLQIVDKGVLREHQDVYVGDTLIGHTTSGTFSPLFKTSIAMALIDKKYSDIGTIVEVDVRGRRLKAKIVEMPFYKRER